MNSELAVLGSMLVLVNAAPALGQGEASNGQLVFNQKCAGCHTISADLAHSSKGPSLMGVIGRTAGSIPGWEFSPALRASGLEFHPRGKPFLVWTDQNLDRWLTDPAAFVPGSRMDLKMPDPFERADVVAYLKNLKLRK